MLLESLSKVAQASFSSSKDYDLFILRRRLEREQEERAFAEKTAEEGRNRARRALAEQKYNWGRFLFWEWENAVKRNQPPMKEGWAKSSYIAYRAHGYTLMTQARHELAAASPC